MQRYTVYRHTAPNGKVYIGITSMEPERRWNNGYGYKRQPYFMNAIRKYGWDNFKHEILFDGLDKEEAERKEIELIAQCRSDEKAYGYNVEHGGNLSGKISEETKRKISKSLKGRHRDVAPWLGKHHTAETKRKLSELHKGAKNPMYGKTVSEETRRKMSEAHKRGKLCKHVLCVETGETFVSATEAAKALGLSQGNVSAVARGERKHSKGYHFKYIEEVTN
jgi:group I intron endonuclease